MRVRVWMGLAAMAVLGACSNPPTPAALGYTAGVCRGDYSFLANTVECGTMVVEETRGSGNGRRVTFPVVRVRALNHPKSDPVLFLHGGPGGGLVEELPERLKEHRLPLTEDRDWIFFDQRGTGMATPLLDCGSLALSDAGMTSDVAARQAADCGRRFSREGVDESQFNTAVIVRDIGELRRALAIGNYNLYGISYGSRVAMGVMQHDPSNLRSVVLDSAWPPETSWTGILPPVVSREMRQVLAKCAAQARCKGRHPNLELRLDGLFRHWLATPPKRNGHQYAAEELAAYLLDALYDDVAARSLPMTMEQILGGDFRALDKFLVAQSGYVEGQFYTVLCREEFAFESPQAIQGADGTDPIAVATARAAKRYFEACKGFAVGKPDPVENQPVTSAIPTLLLSADIDAGCPAELAEAAATRLSRSQVFTLPNTTHGPAGRSPCAKRMVAGFLDLPSEPVDARCIAGDRPVFPFILDPPKGATPG